MKFQKLAELFFSPVDFFVMRFGADRFASALIVCGMWGVTFTALYLLGHYCGWLYVGGGFAGVAFCRFVNDMVIISKKIFDA